MVLTILFVLVLLSLVLNVLLVTGNLNFRESERMEKPSYTNKMARRTQGRKNINLLTVIGLLIGSTAFMMLASYGHLKFPNISMPLVILACWGIALLEYVLQVPANRLGYAYFKATHLKTLQVVIASAVFAMFAYFYFGLTFGVKEVIGFLLIIAGAAVIFLNVSLPECPEGRQAQRHKDDLV